MVAFCGAQAPGRAGPGRFRPRRTGPQGAPRCRRGPHALPESTHLSLFKTENSHCHHPPCLENPAGKLLRTPDRLPRNHRGTVAFITELEKAAEEFTIRFSIRARGLPRLRAPHGARTLRSPLPGSHGSSSAPAPVPGQRVRPGRQRHLVASVAPERLPAPTWARELQSKLGHPVWNQGGLARGLGRQCHASCSSTALKTRLLSCLLLSQSTITDSFL